jgi:hypothetical protein
VSHTGATDGFNESFFDDTVLNVEGKLASALLGCAPTDTVSIAGNVGDLFCLNPFAFFGKRSGTVVGALCYATHGFNFMGINEFCHGCILLFFLEKI